jgi:hypothetical protein
MVKPRLPTMIEARLPSHLLGYLYRFVPHLPPVKKQRWAAGTQLAVLKLQQSPKRTPMDLIGLEDFIIY